MLKYLLFVILVLVSVGADQNVTVAGITIKVLSTSGKIAVYRGANEINAVTITFDEICEKTANNVPINDHTYKTFATLDFVFSNQISTIYPDSRVSVTQFSFSGHISLMQPIQSTAILTAYVYIFTDNGTIAVDDQTETVKPGDMKFNVLIQNWPFCGGSGMNCKNEATMQIGSFLDFAMEIKGRNVPENITIGNKYSLGDGVTVLVPKKVLYDNSTARNMSTGYPTLATNGTKTVFVFRFDKFAISAKYDPIVSLSRVDTYSTTTQGPTTTIPITDPAVEHSGVYARVKVKSGKIEIGSTDFKNQNKITVSFNKLEEISTSNTSISSHSFNSFTTQDFSFSQPISEKYANTNLDVNRITFTSVVTNNATLKIDLFAFKTGGTISNGNEITEVKAGNIKFNIEISGWTFCSVIICRPSETGMYLDVEITIGGALKEPKKQDKHGRKEGDRYDIGSGTIVLSNMVTVDGYLTEIVPGYPLLLTTGDNAVYKFRFPKFANRVVYDPIIDFSSTTSPGRSSIQISVATLLACMIIKSLL